MSWFLKESFNLPDGAFQEGFEIQLAGGGTIYQDTTKCYIKTYADVGDGAIIVSDEGLTQAELSRQPIRWQTSYQLNSLPANDILFAFCLTDLAVQTVPGTVGTNRIAVTLHNNAGTYQERWTYTDTTGTPYYYESPTVGWNAAIKYVRNINLNTTYTLEIIWHHDTKKITLTNGVSTATSTDKLITATDKYWWFIGDPEITIRYGQMTLAYLYVDDITSRASFTLRNDLTRKSQKSSVLTLLNNLTTNFRQTLTLKNSILDHDRSRRNFTLLNNIGVEGQLVYLDGTWVTRNIPGKILSNRVTVEIDGIDVSDRVADWSIDYDDQSICKGGNVTIRDRAYAQSLILRKYSDSDYDDVRVEIIDHEGYSLGEFLIEEKAKSASHGQYTCTLTLRSLTAFLDIPFSQPIDTLYDEVTTKKAVVNALATAKSITDTWAIPDSVLPLGALAAENEPPISVIKKVVGAGGGLVYTDRSDNLVCAYKDYETTGKTPVMSLTSRDIVSTSTSRTVPNGENAVTVEGYQDTFLTGGWAKINLEAPKTKLKSNGFDSCTITATVFNEDLSIPDVELIEEEQEPARNDHYELSVSSMIDTGGGGVVEIKKKSDSSLVPGPYNIQPDGRTIIVGTALDDTTYQVTYCGGETVSFSVDNFADISPTEVVVKNGKAKATLRASSGGGGFAIISGDYLDAQTAKLIVQIADPRVGSIEVSCDPSSVKVGEVSAVKIAVFDSDGYPAQNGLYVDLNVIGYGQMIDYAGVVTPAQVTTTTETLTEGTVNDSIYPVSEIEVSTAHPITSLISIYRFEHGQAYTDINYAMGATVNGSTITLLTPLPSPITPLQITYTSSGIATAIFSYPGYRETPEASITNFISAESGGEYGSCYITIEGPGGGGGDDNPNSSDRIVRWITIEGGPTPSSPNSNGQHRYEGRIKWPNFRKRALVNTAHARFDVALGFEPVSVSWDVLQWDSFQVTVVGLTIQATANSELPGTGTEDVLLGSGPTAQVTGSRTVKDSKTDKGIPDSTVSIVWGNADDPETTKTNQDGVFTFYKAHPGQTGTVTLTHPSYATATATITIPGDFYSSNVNTGGNADTSVTKWSTITVKVSVPYQWEAT